MGHDTSRSRLKGKSPAANHVTCVVTIRVPKHSPPNYVRAFAAPDSTSAGRNRAPQDEENQHRHTGTKNTPNAPSA
jgi:hypothetical protein